MQSNCKEGCSLSLAIPYQLLIYQFHLFSHIIFTLVQNGYRITWQAEFVQTFALLVQNYLIQVSHVVCQ